MSKEKNFKVLAVATFCKSLDIKAKDENAARRIAKAMFCEEGGEEFTEKDLLFMTFAVGHVPEKEAETPELSEEALRRFDALRDAFYDFCLMWDETDKMGDNIGERFEVEIKPFDPMELFYWTPVFNAEIKKGRLDTVFSGGEKLCRKATLIDTFEMEDLEADGLSSVACGVELWLDEHFEFFTTRYAEMVERNEDGGQVTAMRFREEAEKDFCDFVGEFHSEDFYEIIKEKIENAKEEKK